MKIQNLLSLGAMLAAATVAACSSTSVTTLPGTAGSNASTGGQSNVGGNATNTGGSVSTATGGSNSGTTGGAYTSTTGGLYTGTTGGVYSGTTGGTYSGATGGTKTTTTGGAGPVITGGTTFGTTGGTKPTTTGGSSPTTTGGSGSTGRPPGYWMSSDWQNGSTASTYSFSGCAWTGKDSNVVNSTTTVTPQDFTKVAAGGPYAISGSVTADPSYNGVALLGFNLAEPEAGANCTYNPTAASNPVGPPAVAPPSGATGIAVNFSKTGAFTLRVQIQAQDGATNANDRWCYTITAAAGPVFAPLNQFYTSCWNVGSATGSPGTAYAGQPISAVVFTVPGLTTAEPYNFTINGWAFGTSASAAPTGGVQTSLTGTIGSTTPSLASSMQRVKVAAGGHSYIVQNNNWGNPTGSAQVLTYTNNSFVVTSSTGTGSSAPASFPSIYIGANGDTQNGLYDTSSDDNLPKQVSAIKSVQTTFSYNKCDSSLGYNAAYDVWFASAIPTTTYTDAISGFVMVWLCKPNNFSPIGGSPTASNVTLDGHTWNVWEGPRGGSGTNSNAPVVSYVATSSMLSYTFDLNVYIKDAVSRGYIQNSWYLTDVFAGFEIWNGPAAAGLQETAFTAVVQ